jgi:hypothetical protein
MGGNFKHGFIFFGAKIVVIKIDWVHGISAVQHFIMQVRSGRFS